jgi:hypothetical protein
MSAERTPLMRFLLRWLVRLVVGAAVLAAVVYLGDWLVYIARGGPTDEMTVNRYLATALKGNKTEVDFEGTEQAMCAKALFSRGGMQACWYLRRHPSQFDMP